MYDADSMKLTTDLQTNFIVIKSFLGMQNFSGLHKSNFVCFCLVLHTKCLLESCFGFNVQIKIEI